MINTIVTNKEQTVKAVLNGEKVTVYFTSGEIGSGTLEDTAPDQRVAVQLGNKRIFGSNRIFGYLVDGCVFQDPVEGETPGWVKVPLANGKVVYRERNMHHWVPALKCFVESETGSTKQFVKGLEVTIDDTVISDVPDFEYRIKKINEWAKTKTKVKHNWVRVEKTDKGTKVEYDAIMVARVIDLGLSALELVVQVTKALEAIIGVGSVFGIKNSIKDRFKKKIKTIELRENELG